MKLITVGCAGSFAGPKSAASCYLLQVPASTSPDGREWNIVLDLGNGSLGPLQQWCDPRMVDAVAITHLHPDHFVDLAGLYVYLKYHPAGAGSPMVPVWGPRDTAARVNSVYGVNSTETMAPYLGFGTWQVHEPVSIGPVTLTAFPALHPIEAFSLRIEGPSTREPGSCAVVTYTGDTDYSKDVVAAAQGADVLLAEAAFIEGRDDGITGVHLTGRRAGLIAAEAGVRELVLTHIPSWNDPGEALREAGAVFEGPVTAAQQGSVCLL